MSLTNPTRENATTTDGWTTDQINDIGSNLESLEETKVESSAPSGGDISVGDITASSINTDNQALIFKVLSGAVVSASFIEIAHGISESKIRGISPTIFNSTATVTAVSSNSSNIRLTLSGSTSGTAYCVVHYVP